ncbi:ATP-binding cassette domain-containing protein [Clostridium paraputrificum]|nr:ATP-binding cassette domain-containing protein [Clostridium paraputrificum]
MLQIKNLSKSFPNPYGEPNTIFENLSIDIEDGEFVSIIGSNGTGKSTLLNIISGLIKESSGQITLVITPLLITSTNLLNLSCLTSSGT